MNPKEMRTMTIGQFENGEIADISVPANSSFVSDETSTRMSILLLYFFILILSLQCRSWQI